MKILPVLLLGLALASGCQTTPYTSFAPLSAKLEHVPGGVAEHFRLVNSSGYELHNFKFTTYLWSDSPLRRPTDRGTPMKSYFAAGSKLAAGGRVRFQGLRNNMEDPILLHVSFVEVDGHCGEVHFRQGWRNTDSTGLQPLK